MSNRRANASGPEKLTRAWGDRVAASLYGGLMDPFGISVAGMRVLDFGCHWGYFGKRLLEQHGAVRVDGVDSVPRWQQMADGYDPRDVDGLYLHAVTTLDEAEELRDATFDFVFSSGVLHLLPPSDARAALEWMATHVRVGGEGVFNIPSYLGRLAGGIPRELGVDRAHLLFATDTLNELMRRRGLRPLPYRNPSCAATWLVLLQRVGFDILAVRRRESVVPRPVPYRLRVHELVELRTENIVCHVRREREPQRDGALNAADYEGEPTLDLWKRLYEQWGPAVNGQDVLVICVGEDPLVDFLSRAFQPARLETADPRAIGDLAVSSFDLIVWLVGLDRLTPEEGEASLGCAFQLLGAGGELLLHAQCAGSGPDASTWLTPSSYLAMVTRCGFEILDVRRGRHGAAASKDWDSSTDEMRCPALDARLTRPLGFGALLD
jgi:SAM-dependent methyltransferase